MSEIRVLPLPKVDAHYGPAGGKYPETIRVAMSDGKVITYRIEIEMPHPQVLDAIANIRNMEKICIGYKRKEPGDGANTAPAEKE